MSCLSINITRGRLMDYHGRVSSTRINPLLAIIVKQTLWPITVLGSSEIRSVQQPLLTVMKDGLQYNALTLWSDSRGLNFKRFHVPV